MTGWRESRVTRVRGCAGTIQYRAVGSTQETARGLLRRLLEEEWVRRTLVVVAREQTAGRGRGGRSWASPVDGGLYMTLIWPLEGEDDGGRARRGSPLQKLPLQCAVALARALTPILAEAPRLKWPNDLLVGGRKLAGILIETADPGDGHDGGRTVLIGIGVNRTLGAEELPVPEATSIALVNGAELPMPSAAELLHRVASELVEELSEGRPLSAIVAEYRARLVHRSGDRLIWRGSDSDVEGRFEGVDDDGCLLLRTGGAAGRVRKVAAGDIVLGPDGTPPRAEV